MSNKDTEVKEKKHKWYHFIYGKKFVIELVSKVGNVETDNIWYECKKCGKQLTEKQGCTTFSLNIRI
jgi:hypothetical protein